MNTSSEKSIGREDMEPMQIDSENPNSHDKSTPKSFRFKMCIVVGAAVVILAIASVVTQRKIRSNQPLETDPDNNKENQSTLETDPVDIEEISDLIEGDEQQTDNFFVSKEDGVMFETIGDFMYHDKSHFTQGLTYSRISDSLFESNGLYGSSSVCKLDPTTGENIKCVGMDQNYFAEGMQVYGKAGSERMIQITWKEKTGFIYDASTLDLLDTFTFSSTRNEGWGICHDDKRNEFIMSDGSENLHFLNMESFEEIRRIPIVRKNGQRARNINELEYVNGRVLANVWYEDVILVINPETGLCESEYDMSTLWPQQERRKYGADVLNGISVSKEDGVLYITGKKWNRMFKVYLKGL